MRMNIETIKDEVLITLRNVEDEARQLIFRCANARGDLYSVKTEEDLQKYCDSHDLEYGFKHIGLF